MIIEQEKCGDIFEILIFLRFADRASQYNLSN